MGGINHGPCRAYLVNSTKLSRFVSVGRLHLEAANVALEDLILEELCDPENVSVMDFIEKIQGELCLSCTEVENAIECIYSLRQQMNNLLYEDLPTLYQVDFSTVCQKLVEKKAVNEKHFMYVSHTMKESSFYEILNQFENSLKEIHSNMQDLHQCFGKFTSNDRVVDIADYNQPKNFKVEFAKVYHMWNEFQQLLLSSALVSTEVWYLYNNCNSLITQPVTKNTPV